MIAREGLSVFVQSFVGSKKAIIVVFLAIFSSRSLCLQQSTGKAPCLDQTSCQVPLFFLQRRKFNLRMYYFAAEFMWFEGCDPRELIKSRVLALRSLSPCKTPAIFCFCYTYCSVCEVIFRGFADIGGSTWVWAAPSHRLGSHQSRGSKDSMPNPLFILFLCADMGWAVEKLPADRSFSSISNRSQMHGQLCDKGISFSSWILSLWHQKQE